ncbi:hypothetical protein CHARACLAT_025779 [Characodon lateralis]|uniref:Uncharacterized protein n=1 Tax=Characodon lateralis TaxID=208331 RepID=A0ABU7DJV2_9TELE|nr:hypothetical protein [Characodon lateralis]
MDFAYDTSFQVSHGWIYKLVSCKCCAAGFPPANLFLDSTSDPASTKPVHPPPLHSCPPYSPPNTVKVQGTKYLGRTHLRSPTLFPLARLPLLLAVCQQPTSKKQNTISFPSYIPS